MNATPAIAVMAKLVAGALLGVVFYLIKRRTRARRNADVGPPKRPPLGDYRRPPDG